MNLLFDADEVTDVASRECTQVLIVGRSRVLAVELLSVLAEKLEQRIERRWRTVGMERIELDNGSSLSVSSPEGARGRNADLVVFVGWIVDAVPERVLQHVAPCVATSRRGQLSVLA